MLSPTAPSSNPPRAEGLDGHQVVGSAEHDRIDASSINHRNDDESLWCQAGTDATETSGDDGNAVCQRSATAGQGENIYRPPAFREAAQRVFAELCDGKGHYLPSLIRQKQQSSGLRPSRRRQSRAAHSVHRQYRNNGNETSVQRGLDCTTHKGSEAKAKTRLNNRELKESCLGWLRLALSSEYTEVILKKPEEPFVSISRPWRLSAIAHAVANSENIVGIRPEKSIRAIIVDIDNKEKTTSPYWQENGKSKELLALQKHAEDCGCQLTMLQSSESRGLHAILSLPEATPAWLGHWVGQELLRRSGMHPGAGRAEIFPSEIPYVRGEGQTWAANKGRSNGVRLPGQKGCKLITDRGMIEDGELIYQQLICDLENTENCPEWRNLLDSSRRLAKQIKRGATGRHGGRKDTDSKIRRKLASDIRWERGGESAEVLARIATHCRIKYPRITCEYQLADIIRNYAVSAKGYEQYTSEQSKKDIENVKSGWALRWARSSLRRAWVNRNGAKGECVIEGRAGSDKHRNERLYKQSRAKLTHVWKQFKDVSSWSKSQVARAAGMTRRILEKHWDYWLQLTVPTPINNVGATMPAAPGVAAQLSTTDTNTRITYKFVEKYIYIEDFEYIPIEMIQKPELLSMYCKDTC
jgi:hypothetical protein